MRADWTAMDGYGLNFFIMNQKARPREGPGRCRELHSELETDLSLPAVTERGAGL